MASLVECRTYLSTSAQDPPCSDRLLILSNVLVDAHKPAWHSRTYAEQALHDRETCHDAWLGKLKSPGECFGTLEIAARQHCQFLAKTIDVGSQSVSTLHRHLAIAKHADLKTAQ